MHTTKHAFGVGLAALAALLFAGCAHGPESGEETEAMQPSKYTWVALHPKEVEEQLKQLAVFELRFDASSLTAGEKSLLHRVPAMARHIDAIYLEQSDEANESIFAQLKSQYERSPTPENRRLLEYFWINKGPWDAFKHETYMARVKPDGRDTVAGGSFPPGRNFYPEHFTAEDFNAWADTLSPAEAEAARSDFTVIRRDDQGTLVSVPYAEAYRRHTTPLAARMREAAGDVAGTTLARFLESRAGALEKTNDYEASEALWIGLNGPEDPSGGHIDITIGPYENYGDELMKRKAAFQLYVGVIQPEKTRQLRFYEKHIHKMDDHLWELYRRYVKEEREVAPGKTLRGGDVPVRWSKPGAKITLVAVDLAYSAGHANEGYQTLAYNLPNIAAWQAKYGTKKVMMMNMLDGKFVKILKPISEVVMHPEALGSVDQDLFSDNTVRHEVAHGIGPSGITVDGKPTTVRNRLQSYHSPFEEAKAEIVSLLFGYYLAKQGLIEDPDFTKKMAATYTASTFRTIRFGTASDHARGKIFEFNRLVQAGAIVARDGTFLVDHEKFPAAVEKLAMEILDLQMRGSRDDAKHLLETVGRAPAEITRALDAIAARGIPVDLRVKYTFGDNYGVME